MQVQYDGQVMPVSQAFNVNTLEGLSVRVSEMEAVLEMLADYGDFQGSTGTVVTALLRLAKGLQNETIAAITLYQKQPQKQANSQEKGGVYSNADMLALIECLNHEQRATLTETLNGFSFHNGGEA